MKRLPTLVPGLDTILHGGLFEGGVYILEGPPGVGKTTLANQIAYLHATKGAKTLYTTMLSESHARMLQHMEGQTFFRRESVNNGVFYISGYRELEQGGLKGVVRLLHSELVRSGASLLVVDGLVVERNSVESHNAIRQFVHELQGLVTAMSCTCLLLTSGRSNALSAEQTMVDGIFAFEDRSFHWRTERCIEIRKFRGSAAQRGRHTFCISDEGIEFFPRLEALGTAEIEHADPGDAVVPTGIAALDAALPSGGVIQGTASALVGGSGAGKTLHALRFASCATASRPALYMACTESAADLQRLAREHGLPVSELIRSRLLTIRPLGTGDEALDEMGHRMLRLVDELGVKRLVVDGLEGMADTLAFVERGYRFVGRLLRELKARDVVSLFTIDPAALAAASQTTLAEGVIGWFDNAFELDSLDGVRGLSVRKARGARQQQAQRVMLQ